MARRLIFTSHDSQDSAAVCVHVSVVLKKRVLGLACLFGRFGTGLINNNFIKGHRITSLVCS